ncbi:MAG: restriction endonuclease subunit S, partial [Clostridia bacterium]|nr:restriction endonuclease subunit S [Clostridia bacterium]
SRKWFRLIAKPAVNQASISTIEVCAFEFLLPKLEEQKKIANFLNTLDHLITLHQRKCNYSFYMRKTPFSNN